MTDIPSTPADGNIRTLLVAAIANTAAPTVAELTAGTSVNISCYLTPGGFAGTTDQATIADPRECSTEELGQPGRKTRSLTITGIDNTNSANDASYNALVDAMVEGVQIYAARRRGLPFDTADAANQEYEIWPFKPGVKQEVPSEANSVQRSTWTCFPTGPVVTGIVTGAAHVPTIVSALPSGAAVTEMVVITGDFFTGVTAVTFGGTAATHFEFVSATKIVASMPAGSAGSAAIIVTNATGASSSFAYTRGA
jgi:hypothetical protein